jgi:hypothetical protein
MKLEVNIEKTRFFILLGAVLILIGVVGVVAVWDTGKAFFHDANDVKVTIEGTDYSLQEALDDGNIVGDVDVYKCPAGKTPGWNPGGGSWGSYGCQGQISSQATCKNWEYPNSEVRSCDYLGKMKVYP